MPMLDYICLRKKSQINALLDREEFHGKQVFLNAYNKWTKLFKHSRKKEFKFANLLKFMKQNQANEAEQKKAQSKELFQTIRPLLQQKVEKLLTTRVEKLAQTVQSQDMKLQKITEVLKLVYGLNNKKVSNKYLRTSTVAPAAYVRGVSSMIPKSMMNVKHRETENLKDYVNEFYDPNFDIERRDESISELLKNDSEQNKNKTGGASGETMDLKLQQSKNETKKAAKNEIDDVERLLNEIQDEGKSTPQQNKSDDGDLTKLVNKL